LPSHVTLHPKCLHSGEWAIISPSSFLNTHAAFVTSDSYQPSTCSTCHSTRCGSDVISSTDKPTFVNSLSVDGCKTGSTAMRSIGVKTLAAIKPPRPVNV